jgi:hypothetical protein
MAATIPPSIRPDFRNLPQNPNNDSHLADNHDDCKSHSDSDDSDIEELGPESGPYDNFDPRKDVPVAYQQKLSKARYKLELLVGDKVWVFTSKNPTERNAEGIEWQVIEEHVAKASKPKAIPPPRPVSLEWLPSSDDTPLAHLFCHIMFPNLIETLRWYNRCIREYNHHLGMEVLSRNIIKEADMHFFLLCFAVMIGVSCYTICGKWLWTSSSHFVPDEGIVEHPNFDKYIPLYRFKQFKM